VDQQHQRVDAVALEVVAEAGAPERGVLLAAHEAAQRLGGRGVGRLEADVGLGLAQLVVGVRLHALLELLHLGLAEEVEGVVGEEVAAQAVLDVAHQLAGRGARRGRRRRRGAARGCRP
jgi:hypothetical protein